MKNKIIFILGFFVFTILLLSVVIGAEHINEKNDKKGVIVSIFSYFRNLFSPNSNIILSSEEENNSLNSSIIENLTKKENSNSEKIKNSSDKTLCIVVSTENNPNLDFCTNLNHNLTNEALGIIGLDNETYSNKTRKNLEDLETQKEIDPEKYSQKFWLDKKGIDSSGTYDQTVSCKGDYCSEYYTCLEEYCKNRNQSECVCVKYGPISNIE